MTSSNKGKEKANAIGGSINICIKRLSNLFCWLVIPDEEEQEDEPGSDDSDSGSNSGISASDSDSDSSSDSASGSEKSEKTSVPQNESGIPTATVEAVQSTPEGNEEEEEEIFFFSSSRPYASHLPLPQFALLTSYTSISPIPKLNPGLLPVPYITRLKQVPGSSKGKGRESSLSSRLISIRDPEVEKLEEATAFFDGPAPPIPPPELTKSGKPLTKKQKKEVRFKKNKAPL